MSTKKVVMMKPAKARKRPSTADVASAKIGLVVKEEAQAIRSEVSSARLAETQHYAETSEKIAELDSRMVDRFSALNQIVGELVGDTQKQLHRRVQVTVWDAKGVRIANQVHDLEAVDTLTVRVDAGMMCAELTQTDGDR